MINAKIIILLSLIANVACGGAMSNLGIPKIEDGDDKDNSFTNTFNNIGGIKLMQMGSGEQIISQGNLYHDNYTSDNTSSPTNEDSDDKARRHSFNNIGGFTLTQMGSGCDTQSISQGNRYVNYNKTDDTNTPTIEDSDDKTRRHSFNNIGGFTLTQMGSGCDTQSISQGNRYVNYKKSDDTNAPTIEDSDDKARRHSFNNIGGFTLTQMGSESGSQVSSQGNRYANYSKSDDTRKPQTPEESPEQEPVESNVQDQVVDISELPSSNSNIEKDPTNEIGLSESAQINNPDDTVNSFQEDDLILFRVDQDYSPIYWMVVKKDGQYPKPKIEVLLRVYKPSQPGYEKVLSHLTKTEDKNLPRQECVHYKHYALNVAD